MPMPVPFVKPVKALLDCLDESDFPRAARLAQKVMELCREATVAEARAQKRAELYRCHGCFRWLDKGFVALDPQPAVANVREWVECQACSGEKASAVLPPGDRE